MNVVTRFAPSPTGLLHIGNARTALTNWLYAKKYDGNFILRIDNTDSQRCTSEFQQQLLTDLKWLGLQWDEIFEQRTRIDLYQEVANLLIGCGRLYPCYESPVELELKRKQQLAAGLPPLYDRAALKLSTLEKEQYLQQGRKPHYRFLIEPTQIIWNDLVRGKVCFEGSKLSDPIVIREDGSFTYLLCSVVDDIKYQITHILRGEDHITNTATQVQMFQALKYQVPFFGHLNLLKTQDHKISKRVGGFAIQDLRKEGIEPMAINNLLVHIGTSQPVRCYKNLAELAAHFNLDYYTVSPTTYIPQELISLNHKLISQLEFEQVQASLQTLQVGSFTAEFWQAIRANLNTVQEAALWWEIVNNTPKTTNISLDWDYLKLAASLLPQGNFTEESWQQWTTSIACATNYSGKKLYLPLRLAITGLEQGPELKQLLPLIPRQEIVARLTNCSSLSS